MFWYITRYVVTRAVVPLVAILLLFVLFGAGCATLDDLYDEAQLTGDWSKVEKAEAIVDRKAAKEAAKFTCPDKQFAFCVHHGRIKDSNCVCRPRRELRSILRGL